MKISNKQYAESLYEAISGKSDQEIKKSIHNFGLILMRQNDLNRGTEIIESFQKLWDKEHGELSAELDSARELEPEAKKIIIEYLTKKTNALKINLQEKINKKLLGGFILRYNSRVLDGSLLNNLVNLKNKISN